MDSIFLGETELPMVMTANKKYRFRPDLFVSKPHFTSKKSSSRKTDYEEELFDLVKSSRFINFAAKLATSTTEYPSRILPSEISSNSFLESTEKEFRKQPIFSLDKVTTRIDFPDFLVNRLITTTTEGDVQLEVKNDSFLLPKKSSFIICDIKNLSSFPLAKFDIIYMDPPWCNKSVRRGSKYKTSSNDEIFSWIPFETLLSPNGYVSIWITNKQAIETFIRSHFEKFNLKYKGEWS